MRTTRVLVASAAVAAAVAFASPALAEESGAEVEGSSQSSVEGSGQDSVEGSSHSRVIAVPSVIARGGQLRISVSDPKCAHGMGWVSSKAFEKTVRLRPGMPATATATIKRDARPGSYDIKATCNGKTVFGPDAFTVIGGGAQGGLGGSTEDGATGADMAVGGGLVAAAAIGGGVFWMRRRAENRA
ncbi:hypothetical protein HUT18_31865 [Streptomyces sp. NA04227]|uniref:hypothetical protein n=1 Tax=Streptomyces sp. NA04227 TaxID=2742136 RepID=UPI0015919ADD|nr:hypothetical protein [Streptomyces sp. NA04227]QKW10324.1 hypothetical protein HUT18_31865 [Streptomyces sp. NA04227]